MKMAALGPNYKFYLVDSLETYSTIFISNIFNYIKFEMKFAKILSFNSLIYSSSLLIAFFTSSYP